jgi:hypothetical protein
MPRNNLSVSKNFKPSSMEINKKNQNVLAIKSPNQPQQYQPQQQQPISLSNSIKEGFGWGLGSGLGHKLVDSTFNYFLPKNSPLPSSLPSPSKLIEDNKNSSINTNTTIDNTIEYNKCMESHNDKYYCADFLKKDDNDGCD